MDTESVGAILEEIAPRSLAESWDNPGWQVRVPAQPVSGVLLAMEATPKLLEEASALGCNLIFTHHPLLFKPISSLDLASPLGTLLADLLQRKISLWSAHTNLDVLPEGTSFALAKALGLQDAKLLSPVERKEYKLVVYVPASHAEAVKDAMAEAGAGRIGNYSHCFWQVLGTGQFRPEEGASPYLGTVGQVERVEEFRVEGVVPQARLGAVLEAMRKAHPYEEVAYDLLPLANRVAPYGYGAVGAPASPVSTSEMAQTASAALGSPFSVVAGDADRVHQRVAVVGGSGSSFMNDVVRSGATLFITADVRYHDSQEAVARGVDLVILDHFATEFPVLESVRARLERGLPGVPVRIAATASSPYARVKS